jgi:hypothetical protein
MFSESFRLIMVLAFPRFFLGFRRLSIDSPNSNKVEMQRAPDAVFSANLRVLGWGISGGKQLGSKAPLPCEQRKIQGNQWAACSLSSRFSA